MIAIVGAGISGLTLAHDLSRRGIDHVVLEQDVRAGGVIRSARVDGHLLEWGPQRTRLVGSMRALVQEAGIADEVITAPADLPLLVYRNGRLRRVPMSLRDFLATDLISARGKMRALLEPLTSGEHPDETVARYFTRKVGREVYANMIGPLYGGLYASDPADMIVGLSLTHALRDTGVKRSMLLRALKRGKSAVPVACSFKEGMQTLPDALHALHAPNVRLGTSVEFMRRHENGFDLDIAASHGSETLRADAVVFTGSASSTAQLLRSFDTAAAERIASLHYNPLAIVHVYSEDAVTRALGYQVGFDEKLFTRGVTFNDSLFARRGVYTIYLGGAKNPEVVEWDDARIADVALNEFKLATGASSSVLSVARTLMPAWDRTWSALRDLRAPPGIHFCTNWESRPGLPGRLARAHALAAQLAHTSS